MASHSTNHRFAPGVLPGLLHQAPDASPEATLAVIFLGVFPTAVAYITNAYAFSRLPASAAVSFLYLVPAIAFLVAWV